jgi:hypothetical protein
VNGKIPLTLDVLEELFDQLKVMHARSLDGSGISISTLDCSPIHVGYVFCHWAIGLTRL